MTLRPILPTVLILGASTIVASAQTPLGAPWDSVGRILQTSGSATGGYYRYTWPRRDVTLRIGDVTVAPALALGAWAGFSGDAANATVMGDLVLTSGEVKPVLAELARQRIAVSAIHNHLVGEDPLEREVNLLRVWPLFLVCGALWGAGALTVAVVLVRFGCVEHKPAVARRDETLLGRLQRRLGDHRPEPNG